VFTALARKAGSLTSHPVLVGWLHQSTQWAAAGLRRNEQRRQRHEQAAALESVAVEAEPSDSADWDHVRPLLDTALDELKGGDREAVLLRYFENLSYSEISQRLRIGDNAARMRVERALERLRSHLAKRGVTSTAGALGLVLSQRAVAAAPTGLAQPIASTAYASAGAAALGGAAAGLWMGNLQLALVGALVLVLAVGVYREHRRLDEGERALAAEKLRFKTLRQTATPLDRQLQVERAAVAALPAESDLPKADPVDLERKRLDMIVRKGELDFTYAPLFRRLKLDHATLDRLKELLVERNQAIFDAMQYAKGQGLDPTPGETAQITDQATLDIDQRIAAILDVDKAGIYARYQKSEPYRAAVVPWRFAPDASRDRQADELVDLFQRVAPDFAEPPPSFSSEPKPIPPEVLERAKTLLTSDEYYQITSARDLSKAFVTMERIARAAATEGHLKLSPGSARLYVPLSTSTSSRSR
jgi:DNA-directed RNA polymerase specialized sigma24 family protein